MLPFLKRTQDAAISEPVMEPHFDALETAVEELIHALYVKDIKGASSALRAAFEIMDAEPHKEGKHF